MAILDWKKGLLCDKMYLLYYMIFAIIFNLIFVTSDNENTTLLKRNKPIKERREEMFIALKRNRSVMSLRHWSSLPNVPQICQVH